MSDTRWRARPYAELDATQDKDLMFFAIRPMRSPWPSTARVSAASSMATIHHRRRGSRSAMTNRPAALIPRANYDGYPVTAISSGETTPELPSTLVNFPPVTVFSVKFADPDGRRGPAGPAYLPTRRPL